MLGQGRDVALVNRIEAFALGAERRVVTTGRFGDGFKCRLIEMRFDVLTGAVLDESAAVLGGNGDKVAVGSADANGVDFQSGLGSGLGGIDGASFEVFAIGQENQDFVGVGAILERGLGLADGVGNIGAPAGIVLVSTASSDAVKAL